jgi:hypothetical protein
MIETLSWHVCICSWACNCVHDHNVAVLPLCRHYKHLVHEYYILGSSHKHAAVLSSSYFHQSHDTQQARPVSIQPCFLLHRACVYEFDLVFVFFWYITLHLYMLNLTYNHNAQQARPVSMQPCLLLHHCACVYEFILVFFALVHVDDIRSMCVCVCMYVELDI